MIEGFAFISTNTSVPPHDEVPVEATAKLNHYIISTVTPMGQISYSLLTFPCPFSETDVCFEQ